MNNGSVAAAAPVYPAYTFGASPTFNKWVKLTAADVHALRQEPGFESQNIYFHLNHPIRFVYLLGVVVAVDFVHTKFTILTIDDGSGATLEVKIGHIAPPPERTGIGANHINQAWKPDSKGRSYNLRHDPISTTSDMTISDASRDASRYKLQQPSTLCPTTMDTDTPNLTVTVGLGASAVRLCGQEVDVGTTLKVKGTLYRWRQTFQLTLLTAFRVHGANEEARVWKEYSSFCANVLAHPWTLSDRRMRELEADEQKRQLAERDRIRTEAKEQDLRRRERQAARERLAKREAKAERRRAREAKLLDGNPLDRPGKRGSSASTAPDC